MDRMFSRFRSMSGSKLKSPTTETETNVKPAPTAPSKEDILSTLDGFGEKIQAPASQEDNNNTHVRRNSGTSINSTEKWVEVVTSETEPTITSITHSYSLEWEKLFMKPGYLRHLRNYAMKGNLRSSRFRSIAWKLFLDVLPEQSSAWVNRTKNLRQQYKELKDKLIVNPRKAVDTVDVSFNNPLSQEDESPWNRFFLDNELRLTIKQDVIRTFPEIQFYHSESVRDMMINILFCYSREHESLSYRQGMHELLAPMIFVLHCDHQAFLHASEMESLDERIKYVLDPKYLEHDAYAMFAQIMETVEPWYVSKEVYPTKANTDPTSTQPFARPQDLNPSNVIVTKLTRIQDYLLKKADHELHMHLEKQEIAPQIYGIRWIRLLFGREFPMQDLLVLWDAIFADGIGFDLVDYIFVAMLLYLRDHLLSSDYPSCLIILMKYPPVGDIHYFIAKARHLRDPHQYPRPPTYTYQSAQTVERTRKQEQKASPAPGAVPQHHRGSSASMSQVEDSVFRSVPSNSSLGHYETQSARSAISTPDDASAGDGPSIYSTLPTRGRAAQARRQHNQMLVEPSREVNSELANVRGQLNDKQAMCSYCANKLDHHIARLQADLLHQSLENEDEILRNIAGIKQIRDVLKGTLRWSHSLLDEDSEINIKHNHYEMEEASSATSQSTSQSSGSDSSPDMPGDTPGEPHTPAATDKSSHFTSRKSSSSDKRLFYVSSEENSEAVDSPGDVAGNGSQNTPWKLPLNLEVELDNLTTSFAAKSSANKHSKSASYSSRVPSNGPNDYESEFSKSWSPDSEKTSPETDTEESPNPLYRIRNGSIEL